MSDLGPLAAALAKAQTDFPTVKRDKKVTVQKKAGGSYSFNYAPLDSILNAVRAPLAANGLVVVQILDDGALVTSLIHDSGAILSGRLDLPAVDDIQAFGSAITYLRRYAIQAMLGIAAEDDDDGHRAAGNTVSPRRHETDDEGAAEAQTTHRDGLIGKAIIQGTQDFELREGPDGEPSLPFRIKEGRLSQIVVAHGAIALALKAFQDETIDQRVTVWGRYSTESYTKKDETITFKVLHAERIKGEAFDLPADVDKVPEPEDPPEAGMRELVEATSVPLFELTDDEKAAIAAGAPG
jgi:hypothetical protein